MSNGAISRFDNYNLTKKLFVGQGALVGLLALILILLGSQIFYVQNSANEASIRLKSTAKLREVQYDVTDMLALTRGVMITGNEFLAGLYIERKKTFDKDIAALISLYDGDVEGTAKAVALQRNTEEMDKLFRRQIELSRSGDPAQQQQAIEMEKNGESWPPLEKVLFSINDLVELQYAEQEITDANMATAFTVQSISLIVALLAGVLIAVTIARYVGKSIAQPMQGMTDAMHRLAEKDLGLSIPHQERADEIGDMGRALEVFRSEMQRAQQLASERETAQRIQMEETQKRADQEKDQREKEAVAAQAREQQAAQTTALIGEFDAGIGQMINLLDKNSLEMRQTAQNMVGVADQTKSQATSVSAASNDMRETVSTMAAAIEEFSASISEVSQQIQSASNMSSEAVTVASDGSNSIEKLSSAATNIEEVVKLINDIAEQTNLLALNATIEAARAGEAGKGFAVVASEVKSLANQTARATEDITQHINDIQTLTNDAVSAMDAIDERIGSLNQVTLAISAAVDEQEAATSEINRSVQFTSMKTDEVAEDIMNVTEGANQTREASVSVQSVSDELETVSTNIKENVQNFLSKVNG